MIFFHGALANVLFAESENKLMDVSIHCPYVISKWGDCPNGIFDPWVRWNTWPGPDQKFFRRRRRRRPLGLDLEYMENES